LLLIERRIERRLDDVQQTQFQVTERQQLIEDRQELAATNLARLTDEVVIARTELQSAREDLATALASRLSEVREADRALFDSLEDSPSSESLLNALDRATAMGLISKRGCRIPLDDTGIYVNFVVEKNNPWMPDIVPLNLEWKNGGLLRMIRWEQEETVTDLQ
jgi:hypothetical protein